MTRGQSGEAMVSYDVVIPTAGRPSLAALLESLAAGDGPLPRAVLPHPPGPSPPAAASWLPPAPQA